MKVMSFCTAAARAICSPAAAAWPSSCHWRPETVRRCALR